MNSVIMEIVSPALGECLLPSIRQWDVQSASLVGKLGHNCKCTSKIELSKEISLVFIARRHL